MSDENDEEISSQGDENDEVVKNHDVPDQEWDRGIFILLFIIVDMSGFAREWGSDDLRILWMGKRSIICIVTSNLYRFMNSECSCIYESNGLHRLPLWFTFRILLTILSVAFPTIPLHSSNRSNHPLLSKEFK